MNDESHVASRTPGARRLWSTLLLAAVFAGCGADATTGLTSRSPQAPATSTAATAPKLSDSAAADLALSVAALLTPADLHGTWKAAGHGYDFPNSAQLARTLPACVDFAELIFNGGNRHGQGTSATLSSTDGALSTYVVVFPSVAQARAMVAAASTTGFDTCWADFNNAAMLALPMGITAASYTEQKPPDLTFTADTSTVKYLTGSFVVSGTTYADTCVCVFAQVGRGVVEVHSPLELLDPAQRSAVVQTAIDKLRTTLTKG